MNGPLPGPGAAVARCRIGSALVRPHRLLFARFAVATQGGTRQCGLLFRHRAVAGGIRHVWRTSSVSNGRQALDARMREQRGAGPRRGASSARSAPLSIVCTLAPLRRGIHFRTLLTVWFGRLAGAGAEVTSL